MMLKAITSILSVIAAHGAVYSQGWNGIEPLHSNCEDVKRILNVTTCEPPDDTYDLGDERVQITFSKARCQKVLQRAWSVPPGTVMLIELSLRKRIPINNFHIDENKYEKVFTDSLAQTILVSVDEGLSFSVINGQVDRITYMPTPKDYYLLCPDSPKPSQDLNTENFIPWFDKYGNIPLSKEKENLVNVAAALTELGPSSKAYIIAYAGRGQRKEKAHERANRAKNHLITKYRIDAKRILTRYGGRREKLEVEVYVLPPNLRPPTPNPTPYAQPNGTGCP